MHETITKCRISGSSCLIPILSLGDQCLTGIFPKNPGTEVSKCPLDLVWCPDSGLLQLRHSCAPSELYGKNYGYRSGLNDSMVTHLQRKAAWLEKRFKLSPGDVVLDLGSNDATLLKSYSIPNHRLGIDPVGEKFREYYTDGLDLIPDYFSSAYLSGIRPAKVITSIAMFYDLEHPLSFVRDISLCLADDGIWHFEQSYLPAMLRTGAYDVICFKPETLILGENKPISKYLTGQSVIESSGNLTTVEKIMRRTYDGNMIRIQPKYLEAIICTPEHPIMVVSGDSIRFKCGQRRPCSKETRTMWKNAKDVTSSDFLVVPRMQSKSIGSSRLDLSSFNSPDYHNNSGLRYIDLDGDVAWMMGLYVAEGCKHAKGINFSLHEKETGIYQRLKSIFNKIGRSCQRHGRNKYGSKSVEISVPSMALRNAFPHWFGHNARNKAIPDFIMRSHPEIQRQFLIGLFSGDGYVKGNKIHLHTASHVLASQAQLLLASLGAMAGISFCKPPSKPTRKRDGSFITSGSSWQVRGTSPKLAEIFGYEYKATRNPSNICIIEDRRILVPIRSISTEHYSGEVFNLKTKSNTYLASNATVHNCHEHLEYYTFTVVEKMLRDCGLRIIDIQFNDINGGSFAVTACKHGAPYASNRPVIEWVLEQERCVAGIKPYLDFARGIQKHKDDLVRLIQSLVRSGKKVFGYGASTKGNVLLQYCGFTPDHIPFIGDVNTQKVGCYTPGTHIPIIWESEARYKQPDYFLVLPWHFRNSIIEREQSFLRAGGRLIFPFPEISIV